MAVASSRPPSGLRRLPLRLANHVGSSTVTTFRDQYLVSTKTSDSNTTESWWPLFRSSNDENKNSTAVDEKDESDQKTKPRKKRGRKVKPKEKEEEEEEEKPKPKRRWGRKAKEEDEEEDSEEDEKDTKKGKRKKEKDKDSKDEPTDNSNPTSTNTTSTESEEEQERKREAMEKYKEMYRLREQILKSGRASGGRPPMSPEEHNKFIRDANREVAILEMWVPVMKLLIRLFTLTAMTRWWANRMEKREPLQNFVYERLNDKFMRDAAILKDAIDAPPIGIPKFLWGLVLARRRRLPQLNALYGQRIDRIFETTSIVIELGEDSDSDLDLRSLADLITFLLSQHKAHAFGTKKSEKRQRGVAPKPLDLEIVFKLNSGGGSVSLFGLAAAQVARLRGIEGIMSTVCVDTVAASGGYMIASQANKVVAAPFAYVGSIGVMMEMLNFMPLLSSYQVDRLPGTSFGRLASDYQQAAGEANNVRAAVLPCATAPAQFRRPSAFP